MEVAQRRLDAARLARVREVESRGVAASRAMTDTASWWAHTLQLRPDDAANLVKTAATLSRSLAPTAQAVTDVDAVRAEAAQHTRRRFSLVEEPDGSWWGTGQLHGEGGRALNAALDPLAAPPTLLGRRPRPTHPRPTPRGPPQAGGAPSPGRPGRTALAGGTPDRPHVPPWRQALRRLRTRPPDASVDPGG